MGYARQLASDRRTQARLVIVSDRPAADGCGHGGGEYGGPASALAAALGERGGLWFGWSGALSDSAPGSPRRMRANGIEVALTDLTPSEHAGWRAHAERVLRPLLHHTADPARADPTAIEAYEAANRRFARQLAPLLRPDDIVWVHDYHLIPLGAELRAIGWHGATGFSLHAPFPAPEILATLPCHAGPVRALAAYDLVGFETARDAGNFRAALADRRRVLAEAGVPSAPGRRPRIAVLPAGIDPGEVDALMQTRAARESEACIRSATRGQALAVGIDRLDCTAGLPRRLDAYGRLLSESPELRRRIALVQIAVPAGASGQIGAEIERRVGRINGAHGDLSWTPVRYFAHGFPRAALCGLLRAARVGLATPLAGGATVMAREFVAAQDPADPGVLVLSHSAPAAARRHGALAVNAYDPAAMAAAIRQALAMPAEERIRRWEALDTVVRAEDSGWWCGAFLDALESARPGAAPRHDGPGLAQAV